VDEKTRELIAVGTSIGAHCQPCLTYHVAKAKELGVEEEEIREAIAVGHMVEKGAATAMKNLAAGVFGGRAGTETVCCEGRKSKGRGCCG
jgi:AhpD family alkylhydroperoxidase